MGDLKAKLIKIAEKEMEYANRDGSSKLSTCDYRGWDKDVWKYRKEIIQKIRDCGYNVSVSVAWGVTDIVTTKNINL
jgi:hypothetical protein